MSPLSAAAAALDVAGAAQSAGDFGDGGSPEEGVVCLAKGKPL